MELKPGTLLQGGKYKIIRTCGQGGFGITYEGQQDILGKVAIKEFFVKDFCERDDESQQITVATRSKRDLVDSLEKKFYKEAQNLFRLHHENIVRVTDVFKENGTAYYVMDYIDGATINQLLKQEPDHRLKEEVALDFFVQVCDALKYIHSQKMLHLDIKPANLIVQPSAKGNKVMLIDFGVSKQYDEVNGENTSTIAGRSMGYSPIEQMENTIKHFMPATDIFALGATLFRMVTGEKPPSISDIIRNSDNVDCPDFVSPRCAKLIKECMKLNAQDRPQSIDEVLSILNGTDGERQQDDFEDDDSTQVCSDKQLLLNKNREPKRQESAKKAATHKATEEKPKKKAAQEKHNVTSPHEKPATSHHSEQEQAGGGANKLLAIVKEQRKLLGGVAAAIVVIVIAIAVFSSVGSDGAAGTASQQKDTTSVQPQAVAFNEQEFNRLVMMADADAPLSDDPDCQKAARDNYKKALALNPPAQLLKQTTEKLQKVEENIKSHGW